MINSLDGAPPETSVALAFQMRAVPKDCLTERIRALTDDEESELGARDPRGVGPSGTCLRLS
jgi:mRNA-degrading endonuclease toxin of MazEF toxin-antitoxin module